jgi:hypothetical protein
VSLGVSVKTIESSLKWLTSQKWVTVNSRREALHIISYSKLSLKLDLSFRTGVLFEPRTQKDYEYFKSFCCGVVISYYLGKKRYFDRQSVIKKGVAIKNCSRKNGYYPMANAYLGKCLGVSLSTAFRIKQQAEKDGFIDVVSSFSYLEDISGNKIESIHYEALRYVSYKEGQPNRLRKTRQYLKVVESDLVSSHLRVKKKGYGKK